MHFIHSLIKKTEGVTKGHFFDPQFFANNFSYNKDTDISVAPSCFSRQAASNDVLFFTSKGQLEI